MTSRPPSKPDQFDMDSFFDFNQATTQSPALHNMTHLDSNSPFDEKHVERRFNGPSHDYHQFRQQTGLPVGGMPQNMFDGYNSAITDMSFEVPMAGWSSGIDLDADMGLDFNNPNTAMPPMFFPSSNMPDLEVSNNFVNPSNIGTHEEPVSNVGRLWPGMHSQQAQQLAMNKAAQSQAMQQRQMKIQAQHAQYRHQSVTSASSSQPNQPNTTTTSTSKRQSAVAEPHVEESISRLLNQMRQNTHVAHDDNADGMLPHVARMKKDEEDMDEDERLLASEEGKKLSSKERRQLRNKVSARAFRSRRKEYIGQLEGELALKSQEANQLRGQNQNLMHENERYRGLIETLLRHPAFTPFINDISKDPSVLGVPPQQQQQLPQAQHLQSQSSSSQQRSQSQQLQTRDIKSEIPQFDVSKLVVPSQQQNEQQHISLAMIPENDFSKLNLNGFQGADGFRSSQSVNAYALTTLPSGPDPSDLLRFDDTAPDASRSTIVNPDMSLLLAKLEGAARSLDYGRGV